MAEKMIRFLLFPYGKEVDNPWYTEGSADQPEKLLKEETAKLGEVHDITRPYDLRRGEELGAFFSDEERQQIEEGTYQGADAPTLVHARRNAAEAIIQPLEGEGVQSADITDKSSEEVAEIIRGGNDGRGLNVNQTVDLADESDVDSINKVLDAEDLATENEPRAGVTKALEARLARAAEQSPETDDQ
jgi:hypothetical protein